MVTAKEAKVLKENLTWQLKNLYQRGTAEHRDNGKFYYIQI